jgi:hypothetical protein
MYDAKGTSASSQNDFAVACLITFLNFFAIIQPAADRADFTLLWAVSQGR